MMISVVIPTVDRMQDVAHLLDSIKQNSHQPLEIIIVEQGNIDRTREHLASYEECLPLKIVFSEEKSLARARNIGVAHAKGEVVAFLDDDMEIGPNYFKNALEYLETHPSIYGLTGSFLQGSSSWTYKRIIGVLFGLYSWRGNNIVLPSGAYDFVRGRRAEQEQVIEWMFGGNMVFRRSVFEDLRVSFNEEFKKWSFGEDVMLTNEIYRKRPGSLRYLPGLEIRHRAIQTGKVEGVERIKMQIIYRYIFWSRIVYRGSFLRAIAYTWSQIGLSTMFYVQSPSLQTIHALYSSYRYILTHHKEIRKKTIDVNSFISSKEPLRALWRTSIAGKFPFVRLKQFITYPPYVFHFIARMFFYKYISHRYASRYSNIRFLSPQETLAKLLQDSVSLARFSDGDIEQLVGAGEFPPDSDWSQRASKKLQARLKQVLSSKNPRLLVAHESPSVFLATRKEAAQRGVVYNMWTDTRMILWKYLRPEHAYGHAHLFVPSHHPDFNWRGLKEFLKKKDVLIVTGGTTHLMELKLGRRTFFIETGKHDAFEKYDSIRASIEGLIAREKLNSKELLIMASLGPTADILALDLTEQGYLVWDTGHMFKFAHNELKKLS